MKKLYFRFGISTILLLCFLIFSIQHVQAQAPVADFSVSATSGCGVTVIKFYDNSTNNPTKLTWNFGIGGNQSPALRSDKTYSYIYNKPGTYTVSLTASNNSGSNTVTKQAIITIYEEPIITYAIAQPAYCEQEELSFVSHVKSNSPIVEWKWNFGDGTFANVPNPTHTYSAVGSYAVFVSAENANGCIAQYTKEQSLVISPKPTAKITINDSESCTAPFTTTLSSAGSAGNIENYAWNFGDGSTANEENPTHTFTTVKNYDVELIVTTDKGCEDTARLQQAIKMALYEPAISIQSGKTCATNAITFTTLHSDRTASCLWDFGDGNSSANLNPTHTYNSSGTYTITAQLTSKAGCTHTATYTVTIHDLPTVSITVSDDFACELDFTTTFTNTTPNSSAEWNFGDGSAVETGNTLPHTYTTEGDFTILVTVTDNTNSCTNTKTFADYVSIKVPTIDFSTDKTGGCIPIDFNLTDLTASVNAIDSWQWDIIDSDGIIIHTSTDQNPTITINQVGMYSVILTASDATGCSNYLRKDDFIQAGVPPVFDFSSDVQISCFNAPITFTPTSAQEDEITKWTWDFGDGTTLDEKEPLYTHADTGVYDITLIAEIFECSNSISKSEYITINPPIARFTISPERVCKFPTVVEFTDNSVGAEEYFWNFGDGTTLTVVPQALDYEYTWADGINPPIVSLEASANPQYEYAAEGEYTVLLRVTNATTGCEDSLEVDFAATHIIADFVQEAPTGCQYRGIEFTDASTTNYGTIKDWEWIFGDGSDTLKGIKNPIHSYKNSGTYNVELITHDSNGCTDTIKKSNTITVFAQPEAVFTIDNSLGCTPFAVNFSDASLASAPETIQTWIWQFTPTDSLTIDNNNDMTYNWTYSNGDVLLNQADANPSYTYLHRGDYTATLTVIDSRGCDSTVAVSVHPKKPEPAFDVNANSCHYTNIIFTNNSDYYTLSAWDFGDGVGTSSDKNPTYKYTIAEDTKFTIELRVEDEHGCDSTLAKEIEVRHPRADFIAEETIIPCWTTGDARMQNTSASKLGSISSYSWIFEDDYNKFANTSTEFEPIYQYQGPGLNDITLIVIDDKNCTDTLVRTDYITVGGPQGSYSFTPTESCAPATVTFTANATNATKYHWYYGDANQTENSPESTLDYTYEIGDIYNTALVLEDDNGCLSKTITAPDYMTVYEVTPDFLADITIACNDTTIGFTDLSISLFDIDSWAWDFGNDSIATEQHPNAYYNYGTYPVSLTVSTHGCEFTLQKDAYISVHPTPKAAFTMHKNPIRILEPVRLTNISDSTNQITHWQWEIDEIEESESTNYTHRFFKSGNYTISLIAYTHPQCADTATHSLEVNNDVFIPNAFSPNGDGINDIYLVDFDLPLIIVNRWGQEIYEGTKGWDGTYNGKEMSPGTYFYILTLPDGTTRKGPVTLMR